MKCEKIQALILDYLYDELSKEDRELFDSHLARCNECRRETESLKRTSNILQQWEDVEHDIDVMPVIEKRSWMSRVKASLLNISPNPRKIAIGFAYGFTGIFLLLSIANTEISYNDGHFQMSMGILSRPPRQEHQNDLYAQQMVSQLLNENIQLTRSLIQESETRQRNELAYVLLSMQKEIERQRYQDLSMVGYGLDSIQQNTYHQIRQIDHTLTELAHPDSIRR